MEVEKVGKKPRKSVKKLTTKTKWIILFSILGALIIGLIIAIVVVLVTRGGSTKETNDELLDSEIYTEYIDAVYEIDEKNSTGEYSSEEIFDMYREKIEAAKNKKAKALLEIEYYTILAMTNGDEVRNEVVNALLGLDDVLGTARSALAVVYIASFYGDNDLKNKYNEIADERLKLELEEEMRMQENGDTTEEENGKEGAEV